MARSPRRFQIVLVFVSTCILFASAFKSKWTESRNRPEQLSQQEQPDKLVLSRVISTRARSFTLRTKHVTYRPRGILNSEALAFLSMCDLFNVTHVLESGTANGYSTELFSAYLPQHVSITTIDFDEKYGVYEKTKSRLSGHSRIHFQKGDSNKLLPAILLSLPADSRIGVFIDGPKGTRALALAKSICQYETLSFVSIHDVAEYQYADVYSQVREWDALVFDTTERWYRRMFGHMDDEILRMKFSDARKNEQMSLVQSQGYGLAVAIPRGLG